LAADLRRAVSRPASLKCPRCVLERYLNYGVKNLRAAVVPA